MKREIILSLTGLGLLTGMSGGAAPNLEFSQLPPAVQRSIDAHKRNAEVIKVERDVSASGGVYYEVRIRGEKGAKREFYVLENGNLVTEEQMNRPNFEFKARKRQLGQLPTAVQQTVRSQIGNAKVDSIDQLRRDGKTVYEVEYENQGKVSEFLVSQEGALITDGNNRFANPGLQRPAVASKPGSGKVQFNDLPKAVQRTVKSQVGAASVEDIDREVRDGKTTYEVAYKKNGVHTELRVAEDGSILNSSAVDANNVTTASTPLSGGSKVVMADVPEVVRRAIAANVGNAQVEDLEKGLINGKTVYEAAYKRNGVHTELRVAEDGTVLSGGNPSIRESAGARLPVPASLPTPAPVATAPAATPAANESRKVQFFELPAAVQKAVREQAGAAEIEDIDKETRNGKTVYEAAFKKDGKNTELRVNEDGSIAK